MAQDTVRIGLSDLVAFPLTGDTKAALTYGAPFLVAPAVSAKITPNASDDSFYADDLALIANQTVSSIAVELETADIKDEIVAQLMGQAVDENGVVKDNVNKVAPQVALAFRSLKSNGKYKYVVLYKGAFGVGEEEYATKEDKVTFQTTTIAATFLPTVHTADWRAFINEDSDAASAGDGKAIKEWFTSVYGSTSTSTTKTTTTTTTTTKAS